jgi:protein-S-isoprenylcysteine O-methyltransferase Ste14
MHAGLTNALRGCVFTLLVPFVAGLWIPWSLIGARPPAGGWWRTGWLPLGVGIALYAWCLVLFLLSGGTPAIFFTRHLGFLIGREPSQLVRGGPYRFSRNPMYIAVAAVVFGEALRYRSARALAYGCAVLLFFHLVIVFLEEPHLRKARGPGYEAYLRATPRWLGLPVRRGVVVHRKLAQGRAGRHRQ